MHMQADGQWSGATGLGPVPDMGAAESGASSSSMHKYAFEHEYIFYGKLTMFPLTLCFLITAVSVFIVSSKQGLPVTNNWHLGLTGELPT